MQQFLLELLYTWTVIGQPIPVEDFIDSLQQIFPNTDIGTADMEFLDKGWFTRKDSQIVDIFSGFIDHYARSSLLLLHYV
jgi:hypothetical protein